MNIISRFLSRDDVVVGLDIHDKERALEAAASMVERRHHIHQAPVLRALWRREQVGSTGIGQGIAILTPGSPPSASRSSFLCVRRFPLPLVRRITSRFPSCSSSSFPNMQPRNICRSWRLCRRCSQTRLFETGWKLSRSQQRPIVCVLIGLRSAHAESSNLSLLPETVRHPKAGATGGHARSVGRTSACWVSLAEACRQ